MFAGIMEVKDEKHDFNTVANLIVLLIASNSFWMLNTVMTNSQAKIQNLDFYMDGKVQPKRVVTNLFSVGLFTAGCVMGTMNTFTYHWWSLTVSILHYIIIVISLFSFFESYRKVKLLNMCLNLKSMGN